MLLMAYRHGLRVSELIALRLKDIDLDTSRLFVQRRKGSLSTHQPIEVDDLRALRAWRREWSTRPYAGSPYLFERARFTRQAANYTVLSAGERAKLPFRVHPHMLRTLRDSTWLARGSTRGSSGTTSGTETSPTR